MPTLAQVVHLFVHHNGAPNNRVRAPQLDMVIHNVHNGDTVGIGRNVAQITHVANLVRGRTMVASRRVKMRPARCAAIGRVALILASDVVSSYPLLGCTFCAF